MEKTKKEFKLNPIKIEKNYQNNLKNFYAVLKNALKEKKKKNELKNIELLSYLGNSLSSLSQFKNLKKIDSIFEKKINYRKTIFMRLKNQTIMKKTLRSWNDFFQLFILIINLMNNFLGVIIFPIKYINFNIPNDILVNIELTLSVFYLFEYVFEFINNSGTFINFILSYKSVLDILNMLPGFLNKIYDSENKIISLMGVLKSWRIFRLFDLIFKLKFAKELGRNTDDNIIQLKMYESFEKNNNTKMEIYKVITHIICLIYTSTNLILEIQQFYGRGIFILPNDSIELINYPQAIYFVIVTLTTLGYGDIIPSDSTVRIFITILLISYIWIISRDLSILSETLKNFSPYDKNYSYFKNHIIILGYFNPLLIKGMLINFYAEISNYIQDITEVKFLIIGNDEPSIEILSILDNFTLMGLVKYLKADIFSKSNSWMRKANINKAFAILAFADKPDDITKRKFISKEENIIFLCKRIKNIDLNVEIHLYVHSNMSHWRLISWLNTSQIFFANSLKNYFLAIAIENPFFFNFLIQVIYTYNNFNFKNIPLFNEKNLYLQFYTESFSQTFRKIRISDFFIGFTLAEVKKILYFSKIFQNETTEIKKKKIKNPILVIALEVFKKLNDSPSPTLINKLLKNDLFKKNHGNFKFILNFPNHIIQKGDWIYFLSNDIEDINFVKDYSEDYYHTYLSKIKSFDDLSKNNKIEFKAEFNEIIKRKLFEYKSHSFFKGIYSNTIINFWKEEKKNFTIHNHLIIIGEIDAFNKICNISKQYSNRPTVLYSQNQITEEEWKINRKNNSFCFIGSYSNIEHIEQLHIETCYKIVILPITDEKKLFSDSDSIILIRIIKDRYPMVKILVELVDDNSLKFLDNKPLYISKKTKGYHNYHFWPNLINGSVFTSSIFLSFFSKTLYDNSFFDFIKQILGFNNDSINGKSFNNVSSLFHTISITYNLEKMFKTFGDLMNAILTYYPYITVLGLIKHRHKNNEDSKTEFKNRRRKTALNLIKEIRRSSTNFPLNLDLDSYVDYMITNPGINIKIQEIDKLFLIGSFSNSPLSEVESISQESITESKREFNEIPQFSVKFNNKVKISLPTLEKNSLLILNEKSKKIMNKVKINTFKEKFAIKMETFDILRKLMTQKEKINNFEIDNKNFIKIS